MADLERRIANSASPRQSHPESILPLIATSWPNLNHQPHPHPQGLTVEEATVHMLQAPPAECPASYDHYNQDERVMLTQQCTHHLSAPPLPVISCPPTSTYNSYHPPYCQIPVYQNVPQSYHDMSIVNYGDYGETFPSMASMTTN